MSNKEADLGPEFVDGTLGQVENGSTEAEAEAETEASAVLQTAATAVTGGLFQSVEDSSDQSETQNQLLLYPHQSLRSASAGNSNCHLQTSNFPSDFRLEASTIINPHSPISTSSLGNGSLFLSKQAFLHHIISMKQQQQQQQEGPSTILSSRPHEYRCQNLLDQGIGSTIICQPNGASFQLQNISIQRMQMSSAYNNPPALPTTNLPPSNLLSQGQSNQTQFYNPNNTRYIRNSLYDPIYETWGLPVDPHLRMFRARRNNNGYDE